VASWWCGVNIAIKNLQKTIAVNSRVLLAIRKVIRKTWELEGRKNRSGEITVCLVNNRRMRKLNLQYLGQDKPTDVLAFNLTSKGSKSYAPPVADIIVSTESAISNARIFKTCALYELLLYVVHGLLHVFGYEHKNSRQQKTMQNKAARILKFLQYHHE
jgi:probable rRNA maturation factor